MQELHAQTGTTAKWSIVAFYASRAPTHTQFLSATNLKESLTVGKATDTTTTRTVATTTTASAAVAVVEEKAKERRNLPLILNLYVCSSVFI